MKRLKIATIIGTRPQIIKYYPIQKVMSVAFDEVLINTGQHYDRNMAGVFFEELGIRMPDYDMAVGSGSHGIQTAEMLHKIESILIKENPDGILVFGDTNSTLAGTLAAAKLNIPIFHIEAGLRSHNKKMPEEQNRIVADHLSTLLFCPTANSVCNLAKEGIQEGVYLVGDVMYDATLSGSIKAESESDILNILQLAPKTYNLLTLHRAENTLDPCHILTILRTIEKDATPTVFPIHPRTLKFLEGHKIEIPKCIKLIEPTGYLDILSLQKNALKVLSDSGGIQKEAYFVGTPCIVLREETEWVELINNGNNVLTGIDEKKLLNALQNFNGSDRKIDDFGDGSASRLIVNTIREYFLSNH